MNKLKISFAALLMLILVSIFSTAAFAETPVTPDSFVPTSTHPTQGIVVDGQNKGIFVGDKLNNGDTATHRTHGNFQNNTNSCANCHSTHNAAEGSYLMMKSTEYDLCMACHDGTMGFYDVINSNAGAGTFNASHEDSSMHNVEADQVIGQAPGTFATAGETGTLECSSCHNPHGSANDRLLNEEVLGNTYAWNVTGSKGSSHGPSFTKSTTMALGETAINLVLKEDADYADINALTGTGLKITKSMGPDGARDRMNYSNFCAGCHDDYLAKRGASTPKPSATGYTHTTNSHKGGRNCASCHYAHGTDITVMVDSSGRTAAELETAGVVPAGQGQAYMNDVSANGSSAIKKFTNMSVCFSCHGGEGLGVAAEGINTDGTPDTPLYMYTAPNGDQPGYNGVDNWKTATYDPAFAGELAEIIEAWELKYDN